MKCVAKDKMRAVEVGGIEAVVKAINTHISNVCVCIAGCGTLVIMTVNGKNIKQAKQMTNEQLRTK